jgi:mono/diheme cytochrome c family protein
MSTTLAKALGIAVVAIAAEGAHFFYLSAVRASPPPPPISGSTDPGPQTTTHHPVSGAAPRAKVPANLETPSAEQAGAHLFLDNCVSCHGAPGTAPSVQGLVPAAPNLLLAGRRNDPAEVFSKVKNGIRGTAMPAWGDQLPDQSIWALAAFLHHSRGISADAFHALSTVKADPGQESP